MSTTVIYKGQTLTTVENQTRTLQTAGKYLEDDITLTDVSGGGGGSTTSVTIGTQFPFDYLYYVDGTGTVQTISQTPGGVTITCLSKSLIVGLFTLPIEPAATPVGATVYAEISLGSRANYKYLVLFQAN